MVKAPLKVLATSWERRARTQMAPPGDRGDGAQEWHSSSAWGVACFHGGSKKACAKKGGL